MKLFDSHCHLDERQYKNKLDKTIKNANNSNVLKLMSVGANEKSSFDAVKIANKFDGIYASVGIHPHDAKYASKNVISKLSNLAKENPSKVKAWGEIGLDFNRMFSGKEDQEKWFIEQIKEAHKLNLSIIFHERDSKGRLLEILKKYYDINSKAVLHCFSGNKNELKKYLDLGLFIGITGILTLKERGKYLRSLIEYIPDDRLVIETDSPYLTPAPQKNKTRTNEPAFVSSVFFRLAEIKNKNKEEFSEILWDNTHRLFQIL